MSSWSLVCVVMVASYTGKLTSNSVLSKQPLPFQSLSELVQRQDYKWGLIKGTSYESIFRVCTLQPVQKA
jgi:hypothetical protein